MARVGSRSFALGLVLTSAGALAGGCIDPPSADVASLAPTRLVTDRTYLRDAHGRYVFFHGVNVSGSTKAPLLDVYGAPDFLVEPFPIEAAEEELTKLRADGFNVIRLLLQWEAIEPEARGVYDEAYLAHVRAVVEKANDLGLFVLMDMHQDMFSRHLVVKFNNAPSEGVPGSIEYSLLSLVAPYNDQVQGDGAPRWVVEACLPEKDLDSPHWGTPRIVSGLDEDSLTAIFRLYQRLTGSGDPDDPPPEWVVKFIFGLRGPFPVNETTDLLPFSHWGLVHALSVDVARAYACLFAGDVVFPGLEVDGQNVKDYLQEAYAAAWARVAERVADLPNVVGYDLMNEPSGNFLVLTAVGGLLKSGLPDGARAALESALGVETGGELYEALLALRVLPPDTTPETLALWGLDKLDPMAAIGLNTGFSETYGRPFYERVGAAIQREDADAVIFIEDLISATSLTGGPGGGVAGMWENPMTRPVGLEHVVYAPHYYPDIYPLFGFNTGPRSFTPEEVRHRSYDDKLAEVRSLAEYAMGNVPVVFGEFGTYFNYNGIERSVADDYVVSAHILDNYYESFERLFQSNMVWCYSHRNDPFWGDHWNHEDFSVYGPDGRPRAERAWSRPYARALAGKPHRTHFYSEYHYFDPDKGEPLPLGEFEVAYGSKETSAPTEIFVPPVQYPDGFYVWVSDGRCHFDAARSVLYHYPDADEPGAEHTVRLRPPLPNAEAEGWDYFFRGDLSLGGR